MLQFIEILLLEMFRDFFSLEGVFIPLSIAAIALIFFFIQFLNHKQTIVPGVLGIGLISISLLHLFFGESVALLMHEEVIKRSIPRSGGVPIPVFEPLFAVLVAPLEYRTIVHELLFVFLTLFSASVIYNSFKEYKKTGVILGDVSFKEFFAGSNSRPLRSKSNELGSGDLANTEQIAKWTRSAGNLDTVLPVTDLKGSQGTAYKQGRLVIPNGERNRHILAVAKTGSGKTTRLILPILYSDCMCPVRSTIVLDSKPEMWRKLAAMTRRYNPEKNIILFNPLDRARSLSWNILAKIENDTDAKLIANTIIMATDQPQSKSDSPFFRNNALAILNAIMVGLLHAENEVLSMPRIHELVQSGMKPLCDWLESQPQALRNSRTFIELARSGSQNADTIMSELSMRLSAWDLTTIRATTSANELDLETLIEQPTLFIIELRESELEMLRPMANVIVVEILRYLTKRAESCPGTTLPRPVGLVIDEFASAIGRLPDVHVKLNTLRSRNVSIVAAIQSIAQIKANYGDDADSVLAGFSTKIMMPALDLQDAEWASKETGQMTIRFQTASTGSNRKLIEWFASKNDGTQEQVQQRAVLTPDEIGRPADNISTFFLPNTPAFQGFLVPFYKVPEMLKRITEFDTDDDELKLRAAPIKFEEKLPEQMAAGTNGSAAPIPQGISDTKGWTEEQVTKKLDETKAKLDWENTTGSARKWWEAFENENKHRNALVLRLAEELSNRKATITEFFLAYVYSNTDNIQANLFYLDYTRLKKEEEKKKKEAAAANEKKETAAVTQAPANAAPKEPGSSGTAGDTAAQSNTGTAIR